MQFNPKSGSDREAAASPHERAERSSEIAGSREAAARDVERVSPEGRPGDPKAGPARIRGERLVAAAIVVVAVAVSAIWVGWIGAAVALVVGGIALVFNPVMAAAGQRAEDRAEVIERRESTGQSGSAGAAG